MCIRQLLLDKSTGISKSETRGRKREVEIGKQVRLEKRKEWSATMKDGGTARFMTRDFTPGRDKMLT